MKNRTEINDAIELLKLAGFSVIRREDIRDLSAAHRVENRILATYGEDPSFRRRIHKDMFQAMGCELYKDEKSSHLYTVRDNIYTTFHVHIKVIPWGSETDPMLQLIRDDQLRAKP